MRGSRDGLLMSNAIIRRGVGNFSSATLAPSMKEKERMRECAQVEKVVMKHKIKQCCKPDVTRKSSPLSKICRS